MKYSILVIDDDENLRITLSVILQRADYFVTATPTLEEGLQFLDAFQYDLIFLDLQLLEAKGMQVLLRLREVNPEVPILILTANASLRIDQEAIQNEVAGFLIKPVEPKQILERVKEALREYEQFHKRDKIIDEIQNLLIELNEIE